VETLTKRDVGQTPAKLWEVAERCALKGEAAYVLSKGIPTYRVEYIGGTPDPLKELEHQGIYTPPSNNPRPAPQLDISYSVKDIEVIMADIRGEQ